MSEKSVTEQDFTLALEALSGGLRKKGKTKLPDWVQSGTYPKKKPIVWPSRKRNARIISL